MTLVMHDEPQLENYTAQRFARVCVRSTRTKQRGSRSAIL
jgi:hypothetical protein